MKCLLCHDSFDFTLFCTFLSFVFKIVCVGVERILSSMFRLLWQLL